MDATWANFKFGRLSSEYPTEAGPENDSPHSPTTIEMRQGYFDFRVANNNNTPKIFTIAPSTRSGSTDDSSDEQDSHSHRRRSSSTVEHHQQQQDKNDVVRAVAFRPKLEHIGRAYSSAAPSIASKETKSRKERLIDFLHRRFPSRIVRRVLKCTIAYFISILFSLITPVANALGQSAFLTTAGVVFSHPGRSMGAQFDATITAALGVCCGMAFAYAGLASSVAYNVRHMDSTEVSGAINAVFLFVGIFLAQTLRQRFPAFFFFSLQAMIIMIFSFSTTPGLQQLVLPTHLPLQFGLPLLTGTAISQAINILIWPETAVEGLGRALRETFSSSKEMLDMMSKQFFLDPGTDILPGEEVDKTAQKMRAGITKVKTAYRESKREISRTYLNPYELGGITKSLDRLTKHLSILGGSLKTERTLFESALASLERETEMQATETPQHPTEPNDEGNCNKKTSSLRWIDSEDEMRLRKAAMLAAGEYCQSGGKYATSPQNSRPNSRAGSRRNSFDEEENQKSVSSLRSFLKLTRLSGTVPKPPAKANRQIEHGDGELLITYLESLRDPLMQLSKECAAVLDCINHSIAVELDMDDENDISIRETWVAYIRHLLKLKKKPAAQANVVTVNKENGRRHEPNECNCAVIMHKAIKNFDESEHERMRTLYHLNRKKLGSETLDLGLREELFLVFFFIFSLREVANELESMAENMDKIRSSRKGKHFYMPQLTTKWWKKWASSINHQSVRDKGGYSLASLEMAMPKENKKTDYEDEYRLTRAETIETTRSTGSRRRISSMAASSKASSSPVAENTGTLPTLTEGTLASRKRQKAAPADIEKAFSEKEQGEEQEIAPKPPIFLRMRYGLWVRLQYFKTYEFRSALKMAVAVSVLSLPAFIPSSTAWYESVRGQWACMTIIAIMNPTSGGTWQASFWRVIGTLLGGFVGWAALEANGGSPYLLATFGVLLSIPFFYIHLASTYNKIGIVVLLTYMAVAISRYVHPPNEPIAHTVWKRTATVVVGVLVAVSLNWMIWPFVARHAVRKSIAGIIGELGDYFGYLTGTFLYHDSNNPPSQEDIKRVQKIEAKIQKTIDAAAVLLDLTDHEPRLKGPFPKAFYREMIVALRNLLDRMLSMRTALTAMPDSVKKNITFPEYNQLRRDMTAAVILNFYTLQASLKSKIPFPAYIPSARAARLRLIRYRRKKVPNPDKWVQYKNICWFAMASCTEEIIEELEHLNDLVKYIVGESKFADRARRIDAHI